MSSGVYSMITEEFERKRREAERDAEQRRMKIYSEIPALAELDVKMSACALEYAKRMLEGKAEEAEMQKALGKIQKEKDELLKLHGVSPDSFEPRCSCEICRDTGTVDGKYCSCFMKRVFEEKFRASNIGGNADGQSFETFDLNYYPDTVSENYPISARDNAKRNYDKCRKFAENFDLADKSLLLIGGTGLGKTFLSTCVAKRLLADGKSVIYISAVDLFKRIEKSRFDQEDEEIGMFTDCDLLIIDDLGTEAPSAYTVGVFSDIIDTRIRFGGKMILSSNRKLKEFEKLYGERIYSRFMGGFECLLFYGDDIRIQKFMKGE